jgi:hypothetical protein
MMWYIYRGWSILAMIAWGSCTGFTVGYEHSVAIFELPCMILDPHGLHESVGRTQGCLTRTKLYLVCYSISIP